MPRNTAGLHEKAGLLGHEHSAYSHPTSESWGEKRQFARASNRANNGFRRLPLSPRRPRSLGIFVAILFFVWWSVFAIPSLLSFNQPTESEDDGDASEWSFDEITPSEKLEWHPCYRDIGTYKCARLTVAMDYHRPLNASPDNPKVHVALLLVPGIHTGPKPYSMSPLLINPGGPGGSGTFAALYLGKALQTIVGVDQDIIGFDPRGIGATTPRADCFSFPIDDDHEQEDYVSGAFHRDVWTLSGRELGLINSSSESLKKIDVRARAKARLCEQKDNLKGDDSIFRHISTPTVARDMIIIVDAWDEWAESLDVDDEMVDDEATSKDTNNLDTKGKLVYWGFSYGTLLGATFASMFPDRVGRVVLDGVCDADYYVGPGWKGSLRDTDAVSNSFSQYCHQAGRKCALWRKGDSVEDVDNRLQQVMISIKDEPITLIDPNSKVPLIITNEDFRSLMFVILYSPTANFHILAMVADLLYRGLYDILEQIFKVSLDLQPFCGAAPPAMSYPNEAQLAIMCSDKRYVLNETLPNLESLYEELATKSSWADIWMTLMIGCDRWRIKAIDPPMRWDDNPAHAPKPIKTSFPLLFIGNTADPVTPLHAAFKMAGKFEESGLIEQESEGHCSLAAVSLCTMGKVRSYFRDGVVPTVPSEAEGKWDKCKADEWPFHRFGDPDVQAQRGDAVDVAEVDLLNAAVDMQKAFYKEAKFWGHDLQNSLLTGLDLERVEEVYRGSVHERDEI
ncbi:hypothetical protein HYALB_00002188 [Hymenoscyphus albidus]|uniref:Alpha/beta-hydrolase n=1 Tax=Hymenoscyphus albidus TaxID=595503 RepID=A0A9N9LH32_9HELO|nr:hypothetical protein HYALB_00002188 [Hymenoscyphus albidus]